MFVLQEDVLIEILKRHADKGIDLVSYGKPRDAFELPVDFPHWTSGFGGKYEMVHQNIPAGVMIAVGNLEDLDINNQEKLKKQLQEIDIYPTGHTGDFSTVSLEKARAWFDQRSRRDDEVNSQTPIRHAGKLTKTGLGDKRYSDLVCYLADNMNVFKTPDGNILPENRTARVELAQALLDGLSKTVRYTRLDDPAKAFQVTGDISIENNKIQSAIRLKMQTISKILVLRTYKNGETDLTPLDREMIGRTYVTADGEELGDRGSIGLSRILAEAYTTKKRPKGKQINLMSFIRLLEAS